MKLLDRYLIRLLVPPILFGIGVFSSIFIGSDIMKVIRYVTEYGASWNTAGRLLLLGLPQIIVWVLPMAVLLGVLLSLSQLSAASEVVAMRAAGISFYQITRPAIVAGIVGTILALGVNAYVLPAANLESSRIIAEEVKGTNLSMVQRNVILKRYDRQRMTWFLYAAEFDGQEKVMRDVTMMDLSNGKPQRTTYATSVIWDSEQWYMSDAVVYYHDADDGLASMQFGQGRQPADIAFRPTDIARNQKHPDEMTAKELKDHIDILRGQGYVDPKLLTQLHARFATPAATLMFSLVGAPLGIQSHRSASSVGFGMSMAIILVYYIVMTFGLALGESGALAPFLGAWLPNLFVGIAAVILLIRAKK
ncbi:MAG: LptF/LptG family permease [Limnochordia bacterium]|nr:LptF/LptG family permease [Limnochordia bacterium]